MDKRRDEKLKKQRERVRKKAQEIQERLDKLPTLLEAENTAKVQVNLFMLRSQINELYSEMTVYIYLLREAKQEATDE